MAQHLQGLGLAKEYGAKQQQQKKTNPVLSQSLKSNLRSIFYINWSTVVFKTKFCDRPSMSMS